MKSTDVPIEVWYDAYNASWKGLITPESFQHPAKMARGLIGRIFSKLFEMGALQRGDTIVDPFGGVATTAIEGTLRGCRVICCELEPRFVELAQANFALHRADWDAMGAPQPVIVRGDSRLLRQHIGPALADAGGGTSAHDAQLAAMPADDVDAVISSPPYAEITTGAGGLNTLPQKHEGQQGGRSPASPSQDTDARYGTSEGQMGRLQAGEVAAVIGSPPFLGARAGTTASTETEGGGPCAERVHTIADGDRLGTSAGQLAAMDVGSVADCIVSSPPFASGDSASAQSMVSRTDKSAAWVKANCGSAATEGYGVSDGQLGVMKLGDVADAVVTSPPYEASVNAQAHGIDWTKCGPTTGNRKRGEDQPHAKTLTDQLAYGKTEGQIGAEVGETFWSAAHAIVSECFAILRPGGYSVWVLKSFVRRGEIVDFPGDWRRLCEAVGFETVLVVEASLVAEHGQPDIFDVSKEQRSSRKSFFRRLAEAKGSPRIDFEVVLFMSKPT